MALYSEKVMDHFTHPRNVGIIENADGVGEIAVRCHLPAGTVKSSLYRSRRKLKAYLLERGITP